MVNGSTTPRLRAWTVLAAVALVALGLWARCAGFRSVFQGGEVELVPADSHYYVRFALLQLRSFPRFTGFDPFVNFASGARILWPPLHALAVSAAVTLGGLAPPERGAAFVGPVLAGVELAVLSALALRWLRGARAVAAVGLLALLPAAVESGALGNADHHVHEPFIIAVAALALGRALETKSRGAAFTAGLVLGLGRLLTPLAFAFVPLLALAVPAAAGVRRREGEALARIGLRAGLTCAGVLALGVLAFGEARSVEYEFLSWFHPLFALAVFAGGAGLARLLAGSRRGGAGLVAFAAVVAAPLVPQLLRAVGHLGRTDPLLRVVGESRPLFTDLPWAVALLGAPLLALPFALVGTLRRLGSERALEALPALIATAFLVLAAGMQARFAQALAGALAVLLPLGLPYLFPAESDRRMRRFGQGLLAVGALSLLPPLAPPPPVPPVKDVARVRPTLRWMREHLPPASADPYSQAKPAYGVAASYLLGHFINLWAERPALASTFSQAEAHVAGNQRAGAILSCTDDEEAYRRAVAAGARYVLVTPSEVILGYPDFDRPRALLTRLLGDAGMESTAGPATAHFRLVFESAEERLRQERGPYARLFETVPGALLSGQAAPGEEVTAVLVLETRQGTRLQYERRARAGPDGRFALRVAYATAPTSEIHPAPGQDGYMVKLGGMVRTVTVTDAQVSRSETVELPH
ncbi:MAG TPA: peptide transporter [Myxococcaceae bacterium]|nr:peptide transporter [Myxococcaceae bacterium]